MTSRNRGKQSSDDKWFAPKWQPIFKDAVDDACFLLSRGYAHNSVLQIVGNHYNLNKRQRNAINRISDSQQDIATRQQSLCQTNELINADIEIDGLNILILLESALSDAYIFKGRDGTYRDISSVHGSYKRVSKTEEAIFIVGNSLKELQVKSVKWYLDKPVSNSGKLKTLLLEISQNQGFNWEVELVFDPDKILAKSNKIVISSDGWILNNVQKWFNLGALLVENKLGDGNIIVI